MTPLSLTARAAAFALLLVALTPSRVAAQVHPCDAALQTTIPTVASPVTVGFCHTAKDVNGQTTTITQFVVTIGSVSVAEVLTPLTAANATGARYYQFSPVVVPHGTVPVTVTAANVGGVSGASGPVSVCVACSFIITIGP